MVRQFGPPRVADTDVMINRMRFEGNEAADGPLAYTLLRSRCSWAPIVPNVVQMARVAFSAQVSRC